MQPLKLTAIREEIDTIEITTNSGFYIATISREKIISFNPKDSVNLDEVRQVVGLQENFNTIFNSLIVKDEEISQLKLLNNPIIQRNEKSILPHF